ncbi:MAG: hypothetical protein H6649_00840 [Caldilineae bacterium]|nr:hypothetical protein [Anaerolineae bacterium]MCB0202042.1 hypothetical protein [Anaerolineae bacterium]MCB0206583.1 hypothetical protein [Anaerolineae bacterium]MCB0254361.1 hypothetical protein [Anaerolineae bacterium]MCB9152590.1 hypothetical protein [Caldilineae bacterium]
MTSLSEFLAPSLILSTVLAVLVATLWYAWRGGGLRAWVVDVLAALLGFGAGQLIGWWLGLPLPAIGQVRVVEGVLLALLALWLVSRSTIDVES